MRPFRAHNLLQDIHLQGHCQSSVAFFMENQTPKVMGIGGVFFKSANTEGMNAWYRDMLGIDIGEWGASFRWGEGTENPGLGTTAFTIFKDASDYYPGSFMINFRVVGLDALVEKIKANGDRIEDKIDEYSYGRFAWVYDPDGNKIELWEPIDSGF
jgi:catechol 2,3-dioxygenase-like lactoylglutathione lyase family enzyme